MRRTILVYGILGGLLVLVLKLTEYRYLVVEHSLELYGAIVALLFATLGIWLGLKLTRHDVTHEITHEIVREIVVAPTAAEPFVADQARLDAFGITPREHEILTLIADGLSTREIAERLFVSENTVKTHAGRVLAKLDARRRTQAVQIAKDAGLIP